MSIVGYVRVSTISQSETEALSQQMARIKAFGVDDILIDIDSGSSFERVGYLALVDRIKNGLVDKVVFTRLDRIGRSLVGVKEFIDLCVAKKVDLIALDDAIDTTSVSGRFQINMLASFGEMELERIKERINHGHAYRREKLLPYKASFGYAIVSDRLELDRSEFLCFLDDRRVLSKFDLAREIIENFLALKTMRSTILAMIDKYGGVVGFSGSPGLSKWLCNPVLRGYLVYGRGRGGNFCHSANWDLRDRRFEPLMSDEEWLAIESYFIQVRANRNVFKPSGKYCQPFGSLTKCSRCGSSGNLLVGGKNRNSFGYQCIGYKNGQCDNKKWVNINKIYKFVHLKLRKKARAIALDLDIEEEETIEEKRLKGELANLRSISFPSRSILKAIDNITMELKKMQSDRIARSSDLDKRRIELKRCFSDLNFFDYMLENFSKSEIRQFYRRFVVVIWFENGEVLDVDLLV